MLGVSKRANTESSGENRENRAEFEPNFQSSLHSSYQTRRTDRRLLNSTPWPLQIHYQSEMSPIFPSNGNQLACAGVYDSLSNVGRPANVFVRFSLNAGCAINIRSKDAQ